VEKARKNLATLLLVDSSEIVFTSGATESSNIAILGLAEWGKKNNKRHIITTAIEHKSTLEPIKFLESQGFVIDYIAPNLSGRINAKEVISKINKETMLVSIQHVNNETGIIQPIKEIGEYCFQAGAFFHIDASQSFGKLVVELQEAKYNLLSATAHKAYGPQGVGLLVIKKQNYNKPPIMSISFGGGQEGGIRSGTLPVALIAGFGKAAELILTNHEQWKIHTNEIKIEIMNAIEKSGIEYVVNGQQSFCIDNTVNVSFIGVKAEALMIALRNSCSISNGSACTSKDYRLSYVLQAMGIPDEIAKCSIRLSWGKDTKETGIDSILEAVRSII
jgi:cysteine desulfurase